MKSKNLIAQLKSFILIVALFCYGIGVAQMSYSNTDENSVLKSFKDKSIEWGGCPSFMPEGCNIAVLHGDPTKSNADVLFKVDGKSFIPNHWHNSHERMVLLAGKLEVTYKGEATQKMNVGDYAYGPAKKPHTARCVSKNPCILYIGFEEPVDAFAIEK